jgi:hypothetical protein
MTSPSHTQICHNFGLHMNRLVYSVPVCSFFVSFWFVSKPLSSFSELMVVQPLSLTFGLHLHIFFVCLGYCHKRWDSDCIGAPKYLRVLRLVCKNNMNIIRRGAGSGQRKMRLGCMALEQREVNVPLTACHQATYHSIDPPPRQFFHLHQLGFAQHYRS